MRRLLPHVLAAMVLHSPIAAQDVETFLGRYTGANGIGYLTPFAEVVGANLNSGFVRSARIEEGFHVRLDLIVPLASISDDQKFFAATTDGGFEPQTTVDAPTVLGDPTTLVVPGSGGSGYAFPAGFGIKRLGTAIPQITVGSVAGTEVSVRWLGLTFDDFGDFSHVGVGLRHDVSQYFSVPFDLALGGMVQQFKLADFVDAQTLVVSMQGSLERGPATVFGGLSFESASMDVSYRGGPANAPTDVSLDLEGHSGVRLTAGLELGLSLLSVRGDVSVGPQTVFGVAVGLGN